MRLSYTLTLHSDWHVGAGTERPGGEDRLIRRRDGLPFVPAKSMTGVLRDGAELLACGLDERGGERWADLARVLFGEQPALGAGEVADPAHGPQPALVAVASAILAPAVARVARNPELIGALTCTRPGVRIDPVYSTAEDKHLRFVEMARGGLVLHGSLTLDLESEDTVIAFLVCSAGLVRRLGGLRRRGGGRCMLRIDGHDLSGAAELIARRADTPPALPAAPSRRVAAWLGGGPAAQPAEFAVVAVRTGRTSGSLASSRTPSTVCGSAGRRVFSSPPRATPIHISEGDHMSHTTENHRAALEAIDRLEGRSIEQAQREIDADAASKRPGSPAAHSDGDFRAQLQSAHDTTGG